MRPAAIRIVQQDGVPVLEVVLRHRGAHGERGGTEVDRDVGRLRDQLAARREQRAGEVAPLLDVGRVGGALQQDPHLLGDRREERAEDLELEPRGGRRRRASHHSST
jgi:hypothetical protein